MKISARNVLEGRISALTPGAINAEVLLALPGGEILAAIVTMGSVRDLGLAVGGKASALIKAPWLMVVAGDGGPRFAAPNQLRGTVSAIKTGAINAEVAIALVGGTMLHAVIAPEAVAELGLAPGLPVRALIKASDVILAVGVAVSLARTQG